jgi:hypothetical protein
MFDKLFGLHVLGVERNGGRSPEDDDMWSRPDATPDPSPIDDDLDRGAGQTGIATERERATIET